MEYFLANVNDLFEHALQDLGDAEIVRIAIHNESNQNGKAIGMSFRRREQVSVDAIWRVFEMVTQSTLDSKPSTR